MTLSGRGRCFGWTERIINSTEGGPPAGWAIISGVLEGLPRLRGKNPCGSTCPSSDRIIVTTEGGGKAAPEGLRVTPAETDVQSATYLWQ